MQTPSCKLSSTEERAPHLKTDRLSSQLYRWQATPLQTTRGSVLPSAKWAECPSSIIIIIIVTPWDIQCAQHSHLRIKSSQKPIAAVTIFICILQLRKLRLRGSRKFGQCPTSKVAERGLKPRRSNRRTFLSTLSPSLPCVLSLVTCSVKLSMRSHMWTCPTHRNVPVSESCFLVVPGKDSEGLLVGTVPPWEHPLLP